MADASGLEAMRSSSQSAPSLASLRATRPALPKPVRGGAQRLPAVAGARKPPAKKPSSAPKRVTIAEPGEHTPEAPGEGLARGRAVGAFNLAKPKHPNFAESEWENELARSILVLYGSAMGADEDVEGAENDFAIDRDAVRVPRDKITREESEWASLAEGDALALELGALEEAGLYAAYLERVEASLNVYGQKLDERPGDLYKRLWRPPARKSTGDVGAKLQKSLARRQLAVTANVFGARCVETRRFAPALEILKTAERLCACPEILDRGEMAQLRAFVDDSHAFYYYTRAKAHAALMYATRAMRVHARRRDWPHVAKCHLHSAAILSKLRRRAARESNLRPDFSVLHLVETGELDDRGDAPHKLCLVAVTHHNIAVEQLLLHHVEEAVVRRTRVASRGSASYSNRWLDKFESTHRCAAEALSAMGGGLAEGLDKARGRGKGGRGEGGRLTLTHGAAPKERRKTVMIAAG
ncbi:hypothetical protein JL720_8225 [Aureococcus anophagefferens]|nr:hypothetical protein JL720_8225 [Aureococcus anophagefferens]